MGSFGYKMMKLCHQISFLAVLFFFFSISEAARSTSSKHGLLSIILGSGGHHGGYHGNHGGWCPRCYDNGNGIFGNHGNHGNYGNYGNHGNHGNHGNYGNHGNHGNYGNQYHRPTFGSGKK